MIANPKDVQDSIALAIDPGVSGAQMREWSFVRVTPNGPRSVQFRRKTQIFGTPLFTQKNECF